MTTLIPVAVSPLRQGLIDEMKMRRFAHLADRRGFLRHLTAVRKNAGSFM